MAYRGESDADWRLDAFQSHPGDGLLDVSKIPDITLDTGAMQGAGSRIKSAGTAVHGAGGDIHRAWQTLGHHYRAPETAQLLSGSTLVVRKADDVQAHLARIGDAVWHFAAEMDGLTGQLKRLRQEAQDFVDWAQQWPPAVWPDEHCYVGHSFMPGRDRNDQLATEIAGVLSQIKGVENKYASQISLAFDATFDPPPAPREPFHSRTEAEDAAGMSSYDWRNIRLDGYALPWGGQLRADPLEDFVDGVGESVVSTVLSLPTLVGFGADGSGHFGFNLATLKNSWLGVLKMSMATNLFTYVVPSQARANWETISTSVKGLVGIDANGHWGAEGAGRGFGNVALLFIPGIDDLGVGALAAKGTDLVDASGVWWKTGLGYAMKTPELVTTGKWAFIPMRGAGDMLRDVLGAPDFGLPTHYLVPSHSPEELASAGAHPVGGAVRQASAGEVADALQNIAEFREKADHQIADWVSTRLDANRDSLAEKSDAIFDRGERDAAAQVERLRQQAVQIDDAIRREAAARDAMVERVANQAVDAVSADGGIGPARHLGPTPLPDRAQRITDRFVANGVDAEQAARQAQELVGLRGTSPVDWSPAQRKLLKDYVNLGGDTPVPPGPQFYPDGLIDKALAAGPDPGRLMAVYQEASYRYGKAWEQWPEGLRETLSGLAKGELAYELSGQSPGGNNNDPSGHHFDNSYAQYPDFPNG